MERLGNKSGAAGTGMDSLRDAHALLWRSQGGLVRTFSNRWQAFTGRRLDQLDGDAWLAFVHVDDIADLRSQVLRAQRDLVSYEHEYRMLACDGTYHWVVEQGEPFASGSETEFVGVCMDSTLRHERDEESRSRQRSLDQLIQNIPCMVWEARHFLGTTDLTLTFANHRMASFIGQPDNFTVGDQADFLSVVHEEDREQARQTLQRIYRDGGYETFRSRWKGKDGAPVWVQNAVTVIEEHGQVAGIRGASFVIDQEQRSDDLLNFVIEAGRMLASSLDYESTLRNVAQLAVPTIADWCAVHVIDEQGVLQPVSVAHIDPVRVQWVRELQEKYRHLPRRGQPTGPELVVQTGESQFVPVVTGELLDAAILDPEARAAIDQVGMRSYMCVPMELHGNVLGAISFVAAESGRLFDEVDLRAAEHLARRAATAIHTSRVFTEAERERARFRAIVSWLDQAVCHIDSRGRVEHINPAAEALLGFSSGQLRGQILHDVVHSEMNEDGCRGDDCSLVRVFKTLQISRGVETFRRADGLLLPVRASYVPIVLANQTLGAIVSFEDFSDELETSARKDSFLAVAAHQLRTPLTPMIGLSRWLARKVCQAPEGTYDEEIVEVVETLQSESARMGDIVEVFLDLSRIESNRLILDPAPCELRAVVHQAVNELRLRYPGAELELNVPGEDVSVVTDEGRLQQVVRNLLENAAKYGGDPAEIKITLDAAGDTARISVRDKGPGIPQEEHARIFERFYRTENARSKKGLGVGLYLTREIVNQLGGQLSLVSAPGEGAEFIVELPRRMPVHE